MDRWRRVPPPHDWQVIPETTRLLHSWRHHPFNTMRPFCWQMDEFSLYHRLNQLLAGCMPDGAMAKYRLNFLYAVEAVLGVLKNQGLSCKVSGRDVTLETGEYQGTVMQITSLVWLPEIIEKLEIKHQVTVEEVEEVFLHRPLYRRGPQGERQGENLYKAYGQTEAGRYLFIVFIYKLNRRALILSARDMTEAERRLYRRR